MARHAMKRFEMSATDLTKLARLSFEFVHQLCLFVEMNCIKEGVLRIPGDQEEAAEIVESFTKGTTVSLSSLIDPQSAASALKLYLRSHNESLLGAGSWEELQQLSPAEVTSPTTLISLLDKTSIHHKAVLRRILEMLVYISDHHEITKMNPSNLGMVFAPLLTKPPSEDINEEMKVNRKAALLWAYMIENAEETLLLLPFKESKLRLFGDPSGVSNSSIDRLCTRGAMIHFSPGNVIIESGQIEYDTIYFIRKGKVSIRHEDKIIYQLKPGMLVGYSLFLRFGTYNVSPWSYEATTTCEVAKLDMPLFCAILESDTELRTQFYWKAAEVLASQIMSLLEGNTGTPRSDRRRRDVVVNTPPMWMFRRKRGDSPDSPRIEHDGLVIKVFTKLVSGASSFKVISCDNSATVRQFCELCLGKFNIEASVNDYDIFTVDERGGEIHQVPIPLEKDQLVRQCIKNSPNGVPSLFFGQGKVRNKNHLSRSTKEQLQNLLKGRTILCTVNNCKIKGSTGTIYITLEYILHKSRSDKKSTSVFRMDDIEDFAIVKEKEIVVSSKASKTGVTISCKSLPDLCVLFRFLTLLTKSSPLQQMFQSNIEIQKFIHQFPARHLPKPSNMYPQIIKNFRDKISQDLTTYPFWNCGSFKEINGLRENILDYILEQLHPILICPTLQEQDEQQIEYRQKLQKRLNISHFFPSLPAEFIPIIDAKIELAAKVFDSMNKIGKPAKLLQKILDASNLIYEIILKVEEITSASFVSLFVLATIRSEARFQSKLDHIEQYSVPGTIIETSAYFLEQLKTALEILESPQYRSLLESDSDDVIKMAVSKSESVMPTTILTSVSEIFALTEEVTETEEILTQQEGVDEETVENYFYPRAIITSPCLAQTYLELAVHTGQIVDITAGCPEYTKNAVALNRENLFAASYGGCVGWIPKENCRILMETPHNQHFRKFGYSSFFDFPTTNDWFLLRQHATEIHEDEGTVILEKGNRFQRFYIVVDGRVKVTIGCCQYILQEFQCFGGAFMLLGATSLYSVTVNSPEATILEFDGVVLRNLVTERPQLASHFLRYLCCVLQEEMETVWTAMQISAQEQTTPR